MSYSHFDNEVHNGAISITQRGFINDRYKVNPVGQWGKILVMSMGFVDHLGLCDFRKNFASLCSSSEERNLKNPLQTTWTKKPFRLFCSRQYGHVIQAIVLVPEI